MFTDVFGRRPSYQPKEANLQHQAERVVPIFRDIPLILPPTAPKRGNNDDCDH